MQRCPFGKGRILSFCRGLASLTHVFLLLVPPTEIFGSGKVLKSASSPIYCPHTPTINKDSITKRVSQSGCLRMPRPRAKLLVMDSTTHHIFPSPFPTTPYGAGSQAPHADLCCEWDSIVLWALYEAPWHYPF